MARSRGKARNIIFLGIASAGKMFSKESSYKAATDSTFVLKNLDIFRQDVILKKFRLY